MQIRTLLRVRPVMVETEVGTFLADPASRLGNELISRGVYEASLTRKIQDNLKPGGVFIDVGANVGYFSVLASRLVGREGKVVAIEPQSRLVPLIDKNLEANGCTNVTVLPVALGEEPGTAVIHLTPEINSGASSLVVRQRFTQESETVEVTTLDDIVASTETGTADIVKIDVEGFEVQVLRGAHESLANHRIAQLHVDAATATLSGYSPDDVHTLIRSYGYVRDEPLDPCWYRAPARN
jgi:FkbM family methyltransferase